LKEIYEKVIKGFFAILLDGKNCEFTIHIANFGKYWDSRVVGFPSSIRWTNCMRHFDAILNSVYENQNPEKAGVKMSLKVYLFDLKQRLEGFKKGLDCLKGATGVHYCLFLICRRSLS
jgi:hypothetical protein